MKESSEDQRQGDLQPKPFKVGVKKPLASVDELSQIQISESGLNCLPASSSSSVFSSEGL